MNQEPNLHVPGCPSTNAEDEGHYYDDILHQQQLKMGGAESPHAEEIKGGI